MAAEEELYRLRMGFWLRMARERAGKSQKGAAEHLSLSAKSKSTISEWENGRTEVPLRYLRRLAVWYRVPLEVFTHPEPTMEERLDELARGAVELEREDWERAEAQRLSVEAERPALRRRRPA